MSFPPVDVYLHIGVHRTGTTTLQRLLDANEGVLRTRDAGVMTPQRIGRRSGWNVRQLLKPYFANCCGTGRASWLRSPIAARRCRRNFARRTAGLRALLLSDENIPGPILPRGAAKGLYPAIGERMDALGNLFPNRIKGIALSIRRYDAFLFSSFLMSSVYGMADFRFSPYRRAAENLGSGWCAMVRALRERFPDAEVIVWPHESVPVEERLRAFADLAVPDCKLDADAAGERWNIAPTREAIREVRRASASRNLSPAEKDAIVMRHSEDCRIPISEFFPDDERARLGEIYAAHLEALGMSGEVGTEPQGAAI